MTTRNESNSPLEIAARIAGENGYLAKLVVLAVRKNGESFSLDNGLTADEARLMAIHFEMWVRHCSERGTGKGSEVEM